MVCQWSLPNYFDSRTQKNSLGYFSKRHAIKNSSGQKKCDRDCVGWKWSTRWLVEDGMNTALTNTHSSWILWSASCACSKTKHSLFCITSWLPYITLCYIDTKIFCAPGTIMHGSIRLPPRSIVSLWGCSLAINRMISIDPSSLKRKSLE